MPSHLVHTHPPLLQILANQATKGTGVGSVDTPCGPHLIAPGTGPGEAAFLEELYKIVGGRWAGLPGWGRLTD